MEFLENYIMAISFAKNICLHIHIYTTYVDEKFEDFYVISKALRDGKRVNTSGLSYYSNMLMNYKTRFRFPMDKFTEMKCGLMYLYQ